MKEEQLVSILMSTYNESVEYVRKALDSIRKQSYQNLQIIVVLDNPANTELCTYIRKCAEEDSRLTVIANETNRGLVYSLNKALSEAKGEYCARMDADDIAEPVRIETQLHYLVKHQLDLIGSLVIDIDENDKEIHGVTAFPETHDAIVKYLSYGSPLAHPTWFGKRSIFEKLHGYQNIDACEDYDFLCRAVLSGVKLGVVQKPLLRYRINSTGISSTKRSVQKTALYYICQQYRKGKSVTAAELEAFSASDEGKKKKAALEDYYRMSAELKSKKGLSYYLYGMCLYIKSGEARKVVSTINTCKKISRKRGDTQ